MNRLSFYFLVVAVSLFSAPSFGADRVDSACFSSLSKIAKVSRKPFVVSVYSLFNKKPPSKSMKYPEFQAESEDRYKLPTTLKKSDIHVSCLNNIEYAVKRESSITGKMTTHGIEEARPISVIKYHGRYYLSLFDWSNFLFDESGDALLISVVVFDIKNSTRNFIENASIWEVYEGSNLITDISVADNTIKISKSSYHPEMTDDGDIIADDNGVIAKYYIEHGDPKILKQYKIDSAGELVK